MVSKNSETPQCANTNGVSNVSNHCEKTDMNSIQNKELTFHNTNFSYMEMAGQIWLTAAEVGEALGYSDDKAIHRLYRKHADEFTVNMTGVVKVTTPGGVQDSRVFSLRGAHLMGMFSRTTVAKEFRRWVLDILDREVEQGNVNPAFDFEMHSKNMTVARKHFKFIYEAWCHQLDPALRAINSPVAAELVDHLKSLGSLTYGIHLGLERAEKSKPTH
ncbi:BRO-N domain-containing protein [Obesumbacterium proteus]|uniref:Rha family phage protein n=1 Tax=Obesumbacterium proteus ATCC 12841 TaxID=1354268 RepID=A0AA91EGX4_9GAMM|nr:Bro-N domain-containing protein [Obesumbacterium proteus]OAT58457.1 Rha family phage protein [Obesumbacterium proteus ATCC 12841]